MNYKKAIILGAGGFIGINLSHFLVKKGYEVICFDQKKSIHWPEETHSIVGDFSALPESLLGIMDDALVFHLISSCKPSLITAQSVDELKDVTVTLKYLEATKSRALKWIFLSSGGTVYGQSDKKLSENHLLQPICSYGVVKLTIEHYFSLYYTLHKTDFNIIRLANPYGPWQSPFAGQGIIAAILYKALNHQEIQIWGDGENIRDYIYISDVLEAFLSIVNHGLSGEIYNVGTGKGLSINQLVKLISEVVDIDIVVTYKDARSIDVKKNILDVSKIQKETHWVASTSIQQGLSITKNWLKQNHVD